jgi:hypothetical protein
MRRQLRWYGASPLHLLTLLACFGLAGYAATRLVSSHPAAGRSGSWARSSATTCC